MRRLTKVDNRSYLREYALWRGSPPRVVDAHPNRKAHRIIAGQIVRKIKELEVLPPAKAVKAGHRSRPE